jgi:hypothetical protein
MNRDDVPMMLRLSAIPSLLMFGFVWAITGNEMLGAIAGEVLMIVYLLAIEADLKRGG